MVREKLEIILKLCYYAYNRQRFEISCIGQNIKGHYIYTLDSKLIIDFEKLNRDTYREFKKELKEAMRKLRSYTFIFEFLKENLSLIAGIGKGDILIRPDYFCEEDDRSCYASFRNLANGLSNKFKDTFSKKLIGVSRKSGLLVRLHRLVSNYIAILNYLKNYAPHRWREGGSGRSNR